MTETVPKYLLNKPTARDALASLEKIQGPERARTTWRRLCVQLGFENRQESLDDDQLLAVAEQLLEEPGLAPVVGRTLIIRIETFRNLTNQRDLEQDGEEASGE